MLRKITCEGVFTQEFLLFFGEKLTSLNLSMTNNFSKKGVFSRISGWVDDFFLSIKKLKGVEADEFEEDESDIERICVLLMFLVVAVMMFLWQTRINFLE